jgi:biotin carboxyl carrier protein
MNPQNKYFIEGFGDILIEKNSDFRVLEHSGNFMRVSAGGFHYDVVVESIDIQNKWAVLIVDGYRFEVKLKEPLDQLMDQMGFMKKSVESFKNVKSPMPGLIRSIFIGEGDKVEENDKLLSLEAMKMENIIKSPGSGIIKKIFVEAGVAVEKNAVLIEFE